MVLDHSLSCRTVSSKSSNALVEDHKLVYCEWIDVTSTDSSWRSSEEATDWADDVNSIVHQTGFLVLKDQDYLVLACSYMPDLDLVGAVVRIPMTSVKVYNEIVIPTITCPSPFP